MADFEPGWYPDPDSPGSGRMRYWDGAWTEHYHDTGQATADERSTEVMPAYVAGNDATTPASTGAGPAPRSNRTRNGIIAGALVAAAAIGGLIAVLGSGGDDTTDTATVNEAPTATAAPADDTEPSVDPTPTPQAEPTATKAPSEPTPVPTPQPTATEAPTPEPEPSPEPTTSSSASGELDPADQAIANIVAAELAAQDDVPPGVDPACMAEVIVLTLGGAEGLAQDFGITSDNFDPDANPFDTLELPLAEARETADGLLDCGLGSVIVESMTADGFDPQQATCIVDNLDRDIIRDLLAVDLLSPTDAATVEAEASGRLFEGLFDTFDVCDIDPLEFAEGAGGADPGSADPNTADPDSGDLGPADRALVDALAADLDAQSDVPEAVDSECMATAIVSTLGGAEEIESVYGITADNLNGDPFATFELPREQALGLADRMLDCGLGELFIAGIVAEGFSATDAACLVDNLSEELVRDVMAAAFMNADEAAALEDAAFDQLFTELFTAISTCGIDPSSLGF